MLVSICVIVGICEECIDYNNPDVGGGHRGCNSVLVVIVCQRGILIDLA